MLKIIKLLIIQVEHRNVESTKVKEGNLKKYLLLKIINSPFATCNINKHKEIYLFDNNII